MANRYLYPSKSFQPGRDCVFWKDVEAPCSLLQFVSLQLAMSLSLGREAQDGDHGENHVMVAMENSSMGSPGLSETAVASSSSPSEWCRAGGRSCLAAWSTWPCLVMSVASPMLCLGERRTGSSFLSPTVPGHSSRKWMSC